MRVRIIKYPYEGFNYTKWEVQTRKWWQLNWCYRASFAGDDAEQAALRCAKELLDPVIVEVTK